MTAATALRAAATARAHAPPPAPRPDPALRRLDFLVGSWILKGRTVGADHDDIVGAASSEWLPGGFFLRQRVTLDFAAAVKVESEELIGYDRATGRFKSQLFSNRSPDPLPCEWDVRNGAITIAVSHGPLGPTFTGRLGEDGRWFSGGWRPNAGADEAVNVAYDIAGIRTG